MTLIYSNHAEKIKYILIKQERSNDTKSRKPFIMHIILTTTII